MEKVNCILRVGKYNYWCKDKAEIVLKAARFWRKGIIAKPVFLKEYAMAADILEVLNAR